MSERRIRLSKASPLEPKCWAMPLDEALRWVSPYEDQVASQAAIFLTQHAYKCCTAHAASDLKREVGGVLIGEVRREEQDDRLYIIIEDTIQARHTEFGPAHLTFTQDSLVQLNSELEERFPGKRMVGWYHTHPRMDVFLSSYDAWLHANFFGRPWQVALVIEPCAGHGGFFCWQAEGYLDPQRYIGFYELADTTSQTVVNWANLELEDDKAGFVRGQNLY
jgi:proteasome lid subunit RPN8/RPN11